MKIRVRGMSVPAAIRYLGVKNLSAFQFYYIEGSAFAPMGFCRA